MSNRGPYPLPLRLGTFPKMALGGEFQRSLDDLERIPLDKLKNFSRTILVQRAIDKITTGVLAMKWSIQPPKDKLKDQDAIDRADQIERALMRPNRDDHNTYSRMVTALITDMIVLGFAAIERQPGDEKSQPFWLWPVNAANIRLNPEWSADREGLVPRFFDFTTLFPQISQEGIPIMNRNLFLVQRRCNTWEVVPPSPLEVAYNMINAWLGLSSYQNKTTSQAVQESILDIGDVSKGELDAFRQYWEYEVLGHGKTPILAGKGLVKATKIGASTDDGLYHKYAESLIKLIALAFSLSGRDYNLTDHDNRSTSGIAADASFQDAVLPMALCVIEHFELEVIDYYAPGYTIELSDTEPRSEGDEAETAWNLYMNNVITRNEARRRAGEESEGPSGEVFYSGERLLPEEEQPAMIDQEKEQKQADIDHKNKLREAQIDNFTNPGDGANGNGSNGKKPPGGVPPGNNGNGNGKTSSKKGSGDNTEDDADSSGKKSNRKRKAPGKAAVGTKSNRQRAPVAPRGDGTAVAAALETLQTVQEQLTLLLS